MAQSLIRGSTQILAGSVSWDRMAAGAIVPTSSLVDGVNFLKKDGSVAMTASFNAGGFEIANAGAPTSGSSVANKTYVDAAINGLAIRRARVISTANIALSGTQTIDGVVLAVGDRVWNNAQTTASQNGLWVVAAGAWTRPLDWAAASAQKSTQLFIEEGTTNHDTKWILATDAITVDTTSLSAATQDQSGASYTNGTGLSLAGNTFSVIYGTTASTAAQGNDSRIVNALQTTALGANVQSALGVAVGSAGAVVLSGGVLGTPSSGTLTNCSGLPTSGLTGTLAAGQFPALTGDVTTVAGNLATTVNHTAGSGFLKYTDQVANEILGGTPNGANTAFTLAATPQNNSQKIYLNGQRLAPGAGNDYTISGANVTMLFAPQTGDALIGDYQK